MAVPVGPGPRRGRPIALVAGIALLLGLAVPASAAIWTNAKTDSGTFRAHTLVAPTTLSATGGTSANLSWPITSDPSATGYAVYRATVSGGPYVLAGTVASRTTLTFIDTPPASGTYYYVVRSAYAGWESPNSPQASAAVTLAALWTARVGCAAQAFDAGGHGDGYETNPGNACALDSVVARDINSGTGTSTSCASARKDKHRFYDFSLPLPGSVVSINGIEVQTVSAISALGGTNRVCVQLSWDGGTTWTMTQQSSPLTTTLATYTFGTASDRWGHAPWTIAQLANASFRVRIVDVASVITKTFSLDYVGVRVNYTP
jgi:hypothetical protein